MTAPPRPLARAAVRPSRMLVVIGFMDAIDQNNRVTRCLVVELPVQGRLIRVLLVESWCANSDLFQIGPAARPLHYFNNITGILHSYNLASPGNSEWLNLFKGGPYDRTER